MGYEPVTGAAVTFMAISNARAVGIPSPWLALAILGHASRETIYNNWNEYVVQGIGRARPRRRRSSRPHALL